MKFLIDECLSPKLAEVARERGYDASHISWIGLQCWKDWELKRVILDGDWTFVTRNSDDFRGSRHNPGYRGQYADVDIHAGLICLNGPVGMDRDQQIELFRKALYELNTDGDLVNQVLEVTMQDSGNVTKILRYKLPKE